MKSPIFPALIFLFFTACKTLPSAIQEGSIKSIYLNREVKHWVYFPPNYERGKEYALLVMHDGQNLFYDSLAFAGEWRVDETLDSLYKEKGLQIVAIGIENGGEKRIDELTPFPNEKYGGGNGDSYLNYLHEELIPAMDSRYSLSKESTERALMGSSLGGLISFYESFNQTNSFGLYGVYSPSFWYSDEIFDLPAKHSIDNESKMILRIGEKEQNEHLNVLKMDSILQIHQPQLQLKTVINEDGEHSEWYWSRHLYEDILWLFEK